MAYASAQGAFQGRGNTTRFRGVASFCRDTLQSLLALGLVFLAGAQLLGGVDATTAENLNAAQPAALAGVSQVGDAAGGAMPGAQLIAGVLLFLATRSSHARVLALFGMVGWLAFVGLGGDLQALSTEINNLVGVDIARIAQVAMQLFTA